MLLANMIHAMCIVAQAMLFCNDSLHLVLQSNVAHFCVACVLLAGIMVIPLLCFHPRDNIFQQCVLASEDMQSGINANPFGNIMSVAGRTFENKFFCFLCHQNNCKMIS